MFSEFRAYLATHIHAHGPASMCSPRMVVGVLDLQVLHELSVESPFILLLVILFMLMVYSPLDQWRFRFGSKGTRVVIIVGVAMFQVCGLSLFAVCYCACPRVLRTLVFGVVISLSFFFSLSLSLSPVSLFVDVCCLLFYLSLCVVWYVWCSHTVCVFVCLCVCVCVNATLCDILQGFELKQVCLKTKTQSQWEVWGQRRRSSAVAATIPAIFNFCIRCFAVVCFHHALHSCF